MTILCSPAIKQMIVIRESNTLISGAFGLIIQFDLTCQSRACRAKEFYFPMCSNGTLTWRDRIKTQEEIPTMFRPGSDCIALYRQSYLLYNLGKRRVGWYFTTTRLLEPGYCNKLKFESHHSIRKLKSLIPGMQSCDSLFLKSSCIQNIHLVVRSCP